MTLGCKKSCELCCDYDVDVDDDDGDRMIVNHLPLRKEKPLEVLRGLEGPPLDSAFLHAPADVFSD